MNIVYSDVTSVICDYLLYDDYDKLRQCYPNSKVISNKHSTLQKVSLIMWNYHSFVNIYLPKEIVTTLDDLYEAFEDTQISTLDGGDPEFHVRDIEYIKHEGEYKRNEFKSIYEYPSRKSTDLFNSMMLYLLQDEFTRLTKHTCDLDVSKTSGHILKITLNISNIEPIVIFNYPFDDQVYIAFKYEEKKPYCYWFGWSVNVFDYIQLICDLRACQQFCWALEDYSHGCDSDDSIFTIPNISILHKIRDIFKNNSNTQYTLTMTLE